MNNQIPTIYPEKMGIITLAALWIMLLFLFLVPWGDSIWDGLPRVVGTLSLGAALVLFFIHGTHRNYTYFHFFITLFVAWQIVSLAWTSDMFYGTEFANTYAQLLLLAFVFTLVLDNKKKMLLAYQAYVLGNLTGSSIILFNYLNGVEAYYLRYGIRNVDTDTLSVFLALALPVAAYLATQVQNRWLKIANVIAIPLIFYAIFLTGTRTGSVVGVIGLFYWFFTHRKASAKIKASIIIVFVISIVAVFSFAPKASVDRIFSTGKSITTGTLNHRSVIWAGTLKRWEETPILGMGLGGLGPTLSRENINYRHAHNSFIHILAETGIIGLLLYLSLFATILYYALHSPIDDKAFFVTLVMVVMVSQLTTHTQTEKIFWFIYTMLANHAYLSFREYQSTLRPTRVNQ